MGIWWKKRSMCKKQGSFPWSDLGLFTNTILELMFMWFIQNLNILSDKITTAYPDPIRNFLYGQIQKFNKKHEEDYG